MNTKAIVIVIIVIVAAVLGVLLYQSYTSNRDKGGVGSLNFVGTTPDDVLIHSNKIYYRADKVDWIRDLNLYPHRLLGATSRTGVLAGFKNYDATFLPAATAIYAVQGRNDIILALVKESYIPYYVGD